MSLSTIIVGIGIMDEQSSVFDSLQTVLGSPLLPG